MTANVAGLIFFGIAVVLAAGAFFMVLEGTLFETGQRPITTYVRASVIRNPGRTITSGMLFVFVTGLLVAHFFWDAACG